MQIDLLGQAMIEVTEEDADAIVAEVDALGATDAIGGPAPDRRTLTVTNENAAVILRALDHVRDAGHSHRAAQDARDSLLRYLALSPSPTGCARGSSVEARNGRSGATRAPMKRPIGSSTVRDACTR